MMKFKSVVSASTLQKAINVYGEEDSYSGSLQRRLEL